MNDLIAALCQRMAQGLELEPQLLASRLGRSREIADDSINVAPRDPGFASAQISVNRETGMTNLVTLVPAHPMFLPAIEQVLGPYREGRRLHPFDPRKFIFSPGRDTSHPYAVEVVAYVSAPGETRVDSAPVEKLLLFCSAASPREPEAVEPPVELWPRLLGAPVRGSARSLRATTIEDVRTELERALGVKLAPVDQESTYACSLPACDVRLTSSTSEDPELSIFYCEAVSHGESAEVISDALAEQLRSKACDWYVASEAELLEERGELGNRILDHATLVATVASRWLAGIDGENRDTGSTFLNAIADMWISAAQRTSDRAADVRRRKAEFMGWGRYTPPGSRLRVLASYAVQAQLSIVEEQLTELKEMTETERAAVTGLRARLDEWRDVVTSLEEGVVSTGVDSIRSQYDEVLTAIDDLTRGIAMPATDRIRIIPESGFTEETLYPLFVEHNWWIRRRIPRKSDQPLEAIYGTEDQHTNIHFIIDHKIGVNYLLVSGPDAAQVAEALRKIVFHYTSGEIIERARDTNLAPADRRRALYFLALDKMEHGFDQETFDIYSKAIRDPDPLVRGSAVLGSAYLGWPQLADPMRALAGPGEPEESIRNDAAMLVERLEQLASSP
jgi:hypothetical protein